MVDGGPTEDSGSAAPQRVGSQPAPSAAIPAATPSRQAALAPARMKATPAGSRIEYTRSEKTVAILLSVYLIAMFFASSWSLWDLFIGGLGVFNINNYTEGMKGSDLFAPVSRILLTVFAGALGGTLSAMNSLQSHYAAVVENVGNPEKQERERFHPAWWPRWFWGPWMGAGLALLVYALVRSGFLVFTSSGTGSAGSPGDGEKFVAVALGGLVGLSAKDVIDRLIDAFKTWLRVEEPEVKPLNITPTDKEIQYGEVVRFEVTPKVPVNWDVKPNDATGVGTLANGVFIAADKPADDSPQSRTVIVTATSKSDPDRTATATLLLKK